MAGMAATGYLFAGFIPPALSSLDPGVSEPTEVYETRGTDSRTFLCPSRTVESTLALDGDDGCNPRFLPIILSRKGQTPASRTIPSRPFCRGYPRQSTASKPALPAQQISPQPQPGHPVVSGRRPTVCPVTFHIHRSQFTTSRPERRMAGTGEAETGNPVGGRLESHRAGCPDSCRTIFSPG